MKFPEKVETEEEINQCIDAFKYRYLFKQMRKDPSMVFEFFQAGAASRMPFVNLDIEWYYKNLHKQDAYDNNGQFADRWKKAAGVDRYDDEEIDKFRNNIIRSDLGRRHSRHLSTAQIATLKQLLLVAGQDVKLDRPSDSDDSDSSASSEASSSIVTDGVVQKTCICMDHHKRAENVCKGKIKT